MSNEPLPIAYIIAGGAARRMGGRAKGLLEVAGTTVLGRIVNRLSQQANRIILNTNSPFADFEAFGVEVIGDTPGSDEGPLAGLLTCLFHANKQSPVPHAVLTVPGDCPFLPSNLVARLADAMGEGDAAIAASAGRSHPLTGLWRSDLLPQLERAIRDEGLRKARDWAAMVHAAEATFVDTPVDPFFNINTADDHARAEALARQYGL